jgi:hypothetical protein
LPNSCDANGPEWKRDKLFGEFFFHNNLTCYREERRATNISTAQCCYYDNGDLTPEGRWYSGSADDFDPDDEPVKHTFLDEGGPLEWAKEVNFYEWVFDLIFNLAWVIYPGS